MNLERLKRSAEVRFEYQIQVKAGAAGITALKRFLEVIPKLYQIINVESRVLPLIAFVRLDHSAFAEGGPVPENGERVRTLADLAKRIKTRLIFEIRDDGSFNVWDEMEVDTRAISTIALVYEFRDEKDSFILAGEQMELVKPSDLQVSYFALPTFVDLDEALRYYGSNNIRRSKCQIFSDAWHDANRIFFKPQPEEIMRDSLEQFLSNSLRDAVEVMPEQVVDDSHPVDIKVSFQFSAHRALIEIKWLGKSFGTSTNYTASRAKSGAEQLANYLDSYTDRNPQLEIQGYLVVIDGRRRNPDSDTLKISKEDGLHYRDEEIEYDPAYHDIRDDFRPPLRMFAEPKCLPA